MLKTPEVKEADRSLDRLVANYVAVRDHIDEAEEVIKKHLAPFRAKKDELTAELIKLLDEQGTEMARTNHGTVSKLKRNTAVCSDPDEFMDYVRENDLYELLDRRANATACMEHAKQNKGVLPPGVKINTVRYIGVNTSRTGAKL
jgi:hypothetical protein